MPLLYEDTKLLLHVNGADGATETEDASASGHVISFFGNAQLDTADKQFGTSSLFLPGSIGDTVSCGHSDEFNLFCDTTSDKTVEFWIKHNGSPSANQQIIMYRQNSSSANGRWQLTWANANNGYVFQYFDDTNTQRIASAPFGTANQTWTHWAIVKEANAITVYQAGTQVYQTTFSNTASLGSAILWLGTNGGTIAPFKGWMDELRIINQAVYTSDFTPPASEFVLGDNVNKEIELYYDAGYNLSNSNSFLSNIYKAVAKAARLDYDNGYIVNNKISFIYNIYKIVSKELATLYKIGDSISNQVEFLYSVKLAVNSTLNFLYSNGYVVNEDIQVLYKSSAYIFNELISRFYIEKKVSKELQTLYSSGFTVNQDISFLYDSKFFVSSIISLNYNAGYVVNNECNFEFEIPGISNTLNISYDRGDKVSNEIVAEYNLASYVSKSLNIPYIIRWKVYRQFRTLNDSLQYISNVLNIPFSSFNYISSDINIPFIILQSVNNELNVTFNSFEYVYQELELLFNILNQENHSRVPVSLSLVKIGKFNMIIENKEIVALKSLKKI